jgi:hypothetical protein
MKKTYFALAAVAALGLSGAAFAEEATKDAVKAESPAAMSDAEMDGVTAAGRGGFRGPDAMADFGQATAATAQMGGNKAFGQSQGRRR